MFNREHHTEQQKKKRSGFAYSVLGAIIAIFVVTTVFQWKGVSVEVNTDKPSAQADEVTLEDKSEVTQAVEETSPAVVGVNSMQGATNALQEEQQKAGTGSGVIYKQENGNAFVVTNHHVVENASSLEVVLNGGQTVEAELKGSDPFSDLAVLQINDEHVDKVAELGSTEDVEVGQTAIAIGNPLGMELTGSATKGIVSGLNRNIPVDLNGDRQPDWQTEVLQTDAAINPGNSGGPLINLQGEVIGINSMKIAKAEVEGIGFSIPMDVAKPIIQDLEADGEVKRPYMGVALQDLNQVPAAIQRQELNLPNKLEGGVVVASVKEGTPAAEADLQKYDVITAIEGNQVNNLIELRKYLYNEAETGEQVELTLYRNGKETNVNLELSSQ
ncbi:S1C family serine protease [Thalassobacillus sp. CUG 92003]|uniref:S1C family serine protease n=1 Tax=Thalassobacillus sp. CUG 92003 TaxID=2736641 RepID=UPI0015E64922|nr:trypsin-like peptidase domain-containing protein [Thalassobacillus sp. CUG 92003]